MLHYKACARTRKQKIADIALMVFGLVAAGYTTAMTVKVCSFVHHLSINVLTFCQLMLAPEPAGPPPLGQCDGAPTGGLHV